MPLVYSVAGEAGVQIPWQWDNFVPPTLSFTASSDSPFQAMQPLRVYDAAPAMLPSSAGLFGIQMVKGDWSGMVTSQPAPGDLVYLYMTGLGWPRNEETTGVAASPTSVNPIQWDLSCRFLPQEKPAELQFAGIAPGLLGVYQTAFRISIDAGDAPMTGIECTLTTPGGRAAKFGPGIPTVGIREGPGSSFPASARSQSPGRGTR